MVLLNMFFYYSTLSNFTEYEKLKIDKDIIKNRKSVYRFIKMIILSWQISYQPMASVILPLPMANLYSSKPIEEIDRLSVGIADFPFPKVDKIKLTDKQIEQFNNLALQLHNGTITMDEAVLQLRGGDRGVKYIVAIVGFLVFIQWYESNFCVRALNANPLPHQDPFGWWGGKYKPHNASNGRSLANPPSRFERDTLHKLKQMCSSSADENGFVMSYDEAYNLVKETYAGSMQINEDCRVSEWQTLKKSYHFQKGFNIDLSNYSDITKDDLVNLQKSDGGLIAYVQRGGRLPPLELINDCQNKIYDFCHLQNTEINRNATHYNEKTGKTPSIMFFNRETKQIAIFNRTSGDLITASRFRKIYFDQCVDSGQVGK